MPRSTAPRKTFDDVRRAVAENAPPARPEWLCFAWGCPLRGTIFSGGERKCYLHDAHSHVDLQRLTQAINARRAIFDATEALMVHVDQITWWGEIPGKYARPFRDLGRTDLLPTEQERKRTPAGWYARVRSRIEVEVLEDIGIDIRSGRTRSDDTRRPPAESWQGIADVASEVM